MELSKRTPTIQELKLLELLIKNSEIQIRSDWKDVLQVCPMDDGGMGSLRLFCTDKTIENPVFGKEVSSFQFIDLDGILVIASLNIDKESNLFELDVWKTNFDKLLSFPSL